MYCIVRLNQKYTCKVMMLLKTLKMLWKMVQKLHIFDIKAATFLAYLTLKSYEIGKRMKKRFGEC